MKTRRFAIELALLIILALAAGVAWHARRTAGDRRLAQGEAEAACARLRAELEGLRQSATAAEQALAARRQAAARPAPPTPAAPPSPPPPANRPQLPRMGAQGPILGAGDMPLQPLFSDPQLQALRMESHRAALATTYGAFFLAQGFDAAQRTRFIDAILEHNAGLHDLELIGEARSLAYEDPVLVQSREKLAADLRAAQAALLGEAGLAALQRYDRTISLRKWVNGLAGTLAVAGAPLTPAQGEALVQALVTAQPGYRQGGVAQMRPAEWAAFEAAAPAILTPAQLPLLPADIEGSSMGRIGGQIIRSVREALQKRAAAQAGGKN